MKLWHQYDIVADDAKGCASLDRQVQAESRHFLSASSN